MASKLLITDIDGHITEAQNSLSLYPRSHSEYKIGLRILTMARFDRYKLLEQKEDLDKSIVHCTQAIFLLPVSRAELSLDIVQLFFHLAFFLLYSIEFPLILFGLPINLITRSLIKALAVQVRLEARDGTQNIKEILSLYEAFDAEVSPGRCSPPDSYRVPRLRGSNGAIGKNPRCQSAWRVSRFNSGSSFITCR
ncbi:hypothetical protein H4582DRAFT_1919126 [Lactarius indigo]|nr:hypothetical protein H4582DRAFT_1919126 [Lactarius indigo]